MTSTRVLVVAGRLPYPLDDGWKVRTFHIVRAISELAPVTLVTFAGSDAADAVEAFSDETRNRVQVVTVPEPRKYAWWRVALGFLSPVPIVVWNHRSRTFQDAVASVVQAAQPRIGVAVCAFMYPYLRSATKGMHRVVDTHNVDSTLMSRYVPHIRNPFRRLYARLTARKLAGFEDRVFSEADGVWVCSADEQVAIEEREVGASVAVVPNGVDVEHFSHSREIAVPGRLVFFGQLSYFPNEDGLRFLVEEVLPRLERLVDQFEVKVLGAGATETTARLCARHPGVELVGRVPDVRPWLASASLIVVPLRMGSGTRLKVLEAMAAGRPVLSTSVGAEGIVAERGREILEADTPWDFASEAARVLRNPDLAAAIGSAGRDAVRERYAWSEIGKLVRKELMVASEVPSFGEPAAP